MTDELDDNLDWAAHDFTPAEIIDFVNTHYTPKTEVERMLDDLDEIDNKPWRVFRQLAELMPEYADTYKRYESFYSYGGGNKVMELIEQHEKENPDAR